MLVAVSAALVATVGVVGQEGANAAQSRQVAIAGDQFVAGQEYTGKFPDPSILRLGNTYVASSTTVANLNLPIMTSTDLVHWIPRPALSNWTDYRASRNYNEAMVEKPSWAATRGRRGSVELASMWGPSLAKVGGRFLAAYSAATRFSPTRQSCIGIARSDNPLGQYRDPRSKPLVCFDKSPMGAIGPEFFQAPGGAAYLMWKNEGVPNVIGPRLMARRLNSSGTGFRAHSKPVELIDRSQAWEGGVVENPTMVRYKQRYLLFYSGNSWRSGRYATGYAVCRTPLGPCRKPRSKPLLTSGNGMAGPGGADAFIDTHGKLRLAYAAYDAGHVGEDLPRRLHVAQLAMPSPDRLTVVRRG